MAEAHVARDGRQSGAEGEEVGCSRVGSGEEKELGQEERLGRPKRGKGRGSWFGPGWVWLWVCFSFSFLNSNQRQLIEFKLI